MHVSCLWMVKNTVVVLSDCFYIYIGHGAIVVMLTKQWWWFIKSAEETVTSLFLFFKVDMLFACCFTDKSINIRRSKGRLIFLGIHVPEKLSIWISYFTSLGIPIRKIRPLRDRLIFIIQNPNTWKNVHAWFVICIFQLHVISSRYGPMPRVGGLVPLTTKESGPHSTACTPWLRWKQALWITGLHSPAVSNASFRYLRNTYI